MINLQKIDAPSWQKPHARTAILAKAGFAPPAEHAEIADRLAAFKSQGTPVTDRLVAAIVDGQGDVEQLRAGALGEWAGNVDGLNQAVTERVTAAQNRLVREVAADTYAEVQQRFNAAAEAFAKAFSVIDPETPAETVISLGDLKAQKAWQDAAKLADEMDHLLVPLLAAATNAGLVHPAGKDTAASGSRNWQTRSMVLGLIADVTSVENIRDAWSALDADGRTGTWGALLRVGAVVAAKALEDYQPLRRPAPLVDKRIEREDGTVAYVTIDPELES